MIDKVMEGNGGGRGIDRDIRAHHLLSRFDMNNLDINTNAHITRHTEGIIK